MSKELREQVLRKCGLEQAPELSFADPAVVRTPWLWILLFDERDAKKKHFRTVDGTHGKLAMQFRESLNVEVRLGRPRTASSRRAHRR